MNNANDNLSSLVSRLSSNPEDERYMRMALREAQKAFEEKEIPIGCVIVKDGVVIGRGHNQIEMLKDATAHAEILSIGTAAGHLDNWRLDGCTLYVTLEPCPMPEECGLSAARRSYHDHDLPTTYLRGDAV